MKTLAIHGHPTRGKEVIEILVMLGGKNVSNYVGDSEFYIYYINSDGYIIMSNRLQNKFITFTLEEFLEKFPYKVGDKVLLKHDNQRLCTIEEMGWNNKEGVVYSISFNEGHSCWYSTDELLPYKEEIKAEDRLEIYADTAIDDDSKTDITIDGEKLIAPRGYTVKNATTNGNSLIVEYIKNKQYPKTYEDCCKIIDYHLEGATILGYKKSLLENCQRLLICRDAYWKIAGEEMGLYEPWEPYWNNDTQFKFIITCRRDNIIKDTYTVKNCILAFPTEEMRDVFFENFKDLIEKCKELL